MNLQASEDLSFDRPAQIRYVTGSLIYLKLLNRASNQVNQSLGVLLNENTVLTLASNTFDRETGASFSYIQSELAKDRRKHTNPCDFVLMKLPTNASQADTLCFKLSQEETMNFYQNRNQIHILQERCCNLEKQLQEALSTVTQLSQKINELHHLFQDVESKLCTQAGEYCRNNVFKYHQAIDCYQTCLSTREKLFGVGSLETVQLKLDIAHIYSRDLSDCDSAAELYLEVLSIYESHQMYDDQAYSQLLFQIGYAYFRMARYSEAIRFLEQASHNFTGRDEARQFECANFLSMAIQRSGGVMEGYDQIRRKYGFRF